MSDDAATAAVFAVAAALAGFRTVVRARENRRALAAVWLAAAVAAGATAVVFALAAIRAG